MIDLHPPSTVLLSPLILIATLAVEPDIRHPTGQGDEPGAGPPASQQPAGRRHGPQAAAGPVHRDLCPGHWQHAAQPVPGGPVRAGLPVSPGRPASVSHHLPAGGPWGREDTGRPCWQEPASAPEQLHHAVHPLQTQGPQRGSLQTEPHQDAHANVLPISAKGIHPRSH